MTIEDRLAAFKTEHGEDVQLDQVVGLVKTLLPALEHSAGFGPEEPGGRLRGLVDSLGRAENELAALQPRRLSERRISDARSELGAVISHTEQATNAFMTVSERLSELAATLNGDARRAVSEMSTEIFEASAFQDITGQRVNKVLSILGDIETRLSALADAIGDNDSGADEPAAVFDGSGEVIDDRALTHGPQMEGEGNSQDEIDAILASLD